MLRLVFFLVFLLEAYTSMGQNNTFELVSSVKLCWSDALFYCRDRKQDLFTVQSQEIQTYLEERLKRSPVPLTEHVWLGLRRDLRGSNWFWMSGLPMNYANWNKGSVWQNTSPCGAIRTHNGIYTWTDIPCGTHLYFILSPNTTQQVMFWSSKRK